ncbi:MAG: T9SS type A sorting domain-containing protein [Bacteroidales bacterium]|nr:T9SS type A sorting domain-containing protein [Bacteroidales bacterium]
MKKLLFFAVASLFMNCVILAQNTDETKGDGLRTTKAIGVPEISFSNINTEYDINETVEVTANLYSNELIDQLCGIEYAIYRDGVLIENIADYGSLTYEVRQEGTTYYNGALTDGSGVISLTIGEDNIGAFTLGVFDNYCVNRNRPIDFTANFSETGVYKIVITINYCTNSGTATGTSFTAINCDGEVHDDMIAETCENPIELSSEEVTIKVIEYMVPDIQLSEVLPEYQTYDNIDVTAEVYSNGLIDDICGLSYQLYKDGTLIENVQDYGTATYSVRLQDDTYYNGIITEGSGMLQVTAGEETVGAFTLGMFDNYCIDRNRPIDFTINFRETGIYTMTAQINSCFNDGTPTETSFIATNCDGNEHADMIAETCESPTVISEKSVTIEVTENNLTPTIELSEVLSEYQTEEDITVTALIQSNEIIDNLCGIGYEIYKDDVLVTNIADYGTLTYTVRHVGDTYYNGELTEGSGMINVTIAEDNIGAFTLGMFDNYCIDRNRPIELTANITVPGIYKMVTKINSCSNTGLPTGTSFTAINCDGEVHDDMIAETCENPIELSSEEVTIKVIEYMVPDIQLSEVLPEYQTYDNIDVTAEVYSNGLIDQLCGVGYELYKDETLITNIADYGTLTYTVRHEGDTYYNGEITDGSGMINVTVAEDNIGAFTLGIFDNYCVNRNRPIDFTANFNEAGVYKMVSKIYSCSNTGTPTETSFIATNCDGLEHDDMIAETCESPVELSSKEVIITVTEIEAIVINQQPISQTICDYNVANLLVDAETTTAETLTYQWYHNETIIEGETTNTLETAIAGDYYCLLTAGEEEMITEIATVTVAEVNPVLEPIISACNGSTVELNPGSFDTYEWQDASNTQTYEATTSGIFSVTVTDENGCTASVSTELNFADEIIIYWEESVTLCEGSSISLIAPQSDTYQWADGEDTQELVVTEEGWYYVTITQSTCSGNDSIYVETVALPDEFDLGEDIYTCEASLTLSAPDMENVDFLWSTAETTETIEVSETGTYELTIINEFGCERSDDIMVEFGTELIVNLHTSDTLKSCIGNSVILNPETGTSWLWNSGASTPYITVITENWYFVTVTNDFGCQGSDSVFVQFNPLPAINLGIDQEYCANENVIISAPDAVSWLWTTGETTQQITVTNSDSYICTITDENTCQNSDTVIITVHDLPNAELGPDATIQADQTLVLGVPAGEYLYEWNTGANTSNILIDASQLDLGDHLYSITVTNIHDCKSSDQTIITIVPASDVPENIINKISITPNPTNGIINIKGQNINNITIFDNIGKELISTRNTSIDMSKYPSGMYFVKISSNNQTITKKLIKQ